MRHLGNVGDALKSINGKLAASSVSRKHGARFPSDLVKRARAMPTAAKEIGVPGIEPLVA